MAEREFSAGGVVVRDGEVAVIVPHRSSPDQKPALALPKGHIDRGESSRDAAGREVREETGVEAELVDKLGDVSYHYMRGGNRVSKRVEFFLFRYRSGNLEDHDHEVEEALWIPLAEAPKRLAYKGEREMAVAALSRAGEGR
jgi:8-oxo-dGTP pyrophosphatase MutT (NUDIX family)